MRASAKRAPLLTGAGLVLAVCCGCTGNSGPAAGGGSGSAGSPGPPFSLSQITNSFAAMRALKPLATMGSGSIAVILPETATAEHFTGFDALYFRESFRAAGLPAARYTVQTPPGSDQFSAARAAIARGARVLILDARYSGAGVRIQSYAQAHGVAVIDYDWLTLGGTRRYYVGFDSLKIGVLLGQGLVSCVAAWHVRNPRVLVMSGAPTDYNSALYAEGYGAVLARQFHSGWTDAGHPPGTWDPLIAESEFRHAPKGINAALIPNDENARPIIGYLKTKGVKPRTFPTTGLDASLSALDNVLAGYQCGTVYKPVYLEAEAAAALASYVRAGVTPPAGLLNGTVTDPQTNASVAAVLLTPVWVTTQNMKSTVIADGFVPAKKLCSGGYAPACAAAGITG